MAFKSKLHGEEDGLGFVRVTRGLGRKRILVSKSNREIVLNSNEAPAIDSPAVNIPVKRTRSETVESNKSMFESLHEDILIRVLRHVDHEDIARLKRVSKTIRKAVIEAKERYLDYSTPKKTLHFRDSLLISEGVSKLSDQDDEIEAPNAPIRRRYINRESDLSKISMVLFK